MQLICLIQPFIRKVERFMPFLFQAEDPPHIFGLKQQNMPLNNLSIIICLLISIEGYSQQTLSGRISDESGAGIAFANVYLEGLYDGTTSDSAGYFLLETSATGKQVLTISSVGYETYTKEIEIQSTDPAFRITLKEKVSELNEVSITAGVFSAGDKKKSVTLTAIDISTTPSAVGDIYGAFATLPGSQKVGEEGMLFVRGGDAGETKTYMDGMLVRSPYFSSMPRIPTRGRFSPLLFSETVFSTGGYSAEYGNALSSVVDLTTNGLEPEDKASVSLMTVGASGSFSKRWSNTSLAITGLYANNALHHKLFKQKVEWIKDPVMADGMVMFRQKLGETGLLKSFCSFNGQTMEMNYDNFEAGTLDRVRLTNRNLYANTTYTGELNDKWLIRTGVAYGRDLEDMLYINQPVITTQSSLSGKLVFTHLTGQRLKIRMGTDINREQYIQEVNPDSTIFLKMNDIYPSMFVEPELKISDKLAIRMGLRAEYSSLLEEGTLLPRLSAAYKTGKYSQVSMAWGRFSQKPGIDYLKFAPGLDLENADHYIVNYQYKRILRTFRIEAYYKTYRNLVKYRELYSIDPESYSNKGNGYAGGVDIFWRDRQTLKGVDYWISYSYLHTRRDYKDYPQRVMPNFASAHNLSVVYKQFIAPITTFLGATYSFASGRPYDNKNTEEFMSGRTTPYHDVSLNLTYLTRIFHRDCILHMNITNLLGFKNVFGYLYSETEGEDGTYPSKAIVPTAGRQAILVFMMTL